MKYFNNISTSLAKWYSPTKKEKPDDLRGEFDLQQELEKLAYEYHQRTEDFDQRVCRARTKNGIAIPITSQECYLVNRNAHRVMKEILCKGSALGFTKPEITKAIQVAARSFEYESSIGEVSHE